MSAVPSVTLIVVTHNSAAIISATLEAIFAQTYPQAQMRVVVVDNASRDQTVALIRQRYPRVCLIAERRNMGFAAGNNLAMRHAPSDFYALINPDVTLHPDWLRHAVHAMTTEPPIGVVGSKIFYGNRRLLQHVGGMLRDNLLTYHLGADELDIGQYDQPHEVPYVMGAALLIRREVAEALGYLPEAYFMYYEETEFCLRARQSGWRVLYWPDAVAYHDEHRSLSNRHDGRYSARFLRAYHQSRYLFALRTLHTAAERERFIAAERAWRRSLGRAPRRRWWLLRSLLAHWRVLLTAEGWWLLWVVRG